MQNDENNVVPSAENVQPVSAPVKRRGRPPGSKNKPKAPTSSVEAGTLVLVEPEVLEESAVEHTPTRAHRDVETVEVRMDPHSLRAAKNKFYTHKDMVAFLDELDALMQAWHGAARPILYSDECRDQVMALAEKLGL